MKILDQPIPLKRVYSNARINRHCLNDLCLDTNELGSSSIADLSSRRILSIKAVEVATAGAGATAVGAIAYIPRAGLTTRGPDDALGAWNVLGAGWSKGPRSSFSSTASPGAACVAGCEGVAKCTRCCS